MQQKILLSVVGPTAIGKTALAISLAQYFGTEIISSDSRQFYREMKIGTAVPNEKELTLANHHFIQHKSILDPYSVGDFEKDALQVLEKIFSVKNFAIMVGGSGLYNDAVRFGLDEFPKIDSDIREKLNIIFQEDGIEKLQELLKKDDFMYYGKVDLENPHRIIRALEVYRSTGKPYSSFLGKAKKPRLFKTITIGLEADRPLLYERINSRVDCMIDNGLVSEVNALKSHKERNALQTVGYKELFHYLDGNWTLEFAISEIKKNTRRFAKRQMTWLKKKDVVWVPYNIELKELISIVANNIPLTNNNTFGKS